MKTFTQKTNDFISDNNLPYSIELFNTVLANIKQDAKNIEQETLRTLNLNKNVINNNSYILNSICYSVKNYKF
jgi:hypothetical protein